MENRQGRNNAGAVPTYDRFDHEMWRWRLGCATAERERERQANRKRNLRPAPTGPEVEGFHSLIFLLFLQRISSLQIIET